MTSNSRDKKRSVLESINEGIIRFYRILASDRTSLDGENGVRV